MRLLLRIGCFVLLAGCSRQTPHADRMRTVTVYRPDGRVYSEISYKGKKQHGLSKTYHPDGKLYLEVEYQDGVKHGVSKQYYQNGMLYLEAQYVDGVMEGEARKYHKDGKLKAEMFFRDDFPCAGLKEYILNGDPRPHYPEIIITPENWLLPDHEYRLYVTLSERVQSAEFYIGTLKDNCLHNALRLVKATGKDSGLITVQVLPGESVHASVNIVARIETLAGNILVTEQTHRLDIDFAR